MYTREAVNMAAVMAIAVIISYGAVNFFGVMKEPTAEEIQQRAENVATELERRNTDQVATMAKDMVFFQEPQTGICFAASGWYYGQVMTTVDCSQVPAALLRHPAKQATNQ